MLNEVGDYYILNAYNEQPDCAICDNCMASFDFCCNQCGTEHGWAGYERTISKKEYWKGVQESQ